MVGDVEFESLNRAQLAGWLARSRAGYLDQMMTAGSTRAEAEANADYAFERSFPGGRPAPGHLVGRVVAPGVGPVGDLWVGPHDADRHRWWVWDVVVYEEFRHRGFGRAAMLLAERLAAEAGATSIGLNVFAYNEVARHLYGSLGYEETSVQMRKALRPPD